MNFFGNLFKKEEPKPNQPFLDQPQPQPQPSGFMGQLSKFNPFSKGGKKQKKSKQIKIKTKKTKTKKNRK